MNRIKLLREEAGLSQEQLAIAIEAKQRTVGRWENNESDPPSATLIKIADYFNVSIDYLVGRENDIGIINVNNDIINKPEMRPAVINVAKKIDQLNDMGIAIVIGYVARLLEQKEYKRG